MVSERVSDKTRESLVVSARMLFAQSGYADVSVAAVSAHAGVTKGALYHHFPNKEDLFAAVLSHVEAELQTRSRAAARGARSVRGKLLAGFAAYLDCVVDPGIGRIALIEGPVVLGPTRYHELTSRFSHDDTAFVLGAMLPAAEPNEIDMLTWMLLGALNSAALSITTSAKPKQTRITAGAAVERLIHGLSPAK